MKYFAVFALLAVFAVALAEQPANEKIEPAKSDAEAAARDKRGVLLGAAYTAPVAYAAYAAPVAYTGYNYPYAYSAYRSYPYYYNSPYIVG